MSSSKMRSDRTHALLLCFSVAAGIALAPATASAGFFDQLFGGAPQPAQPSYSYQPEQPMSPDSAMPAAPRVKKKVAAREVAPVRQKTTDLWHDKTLRAGDAIMMKDGVHIYNGSETVKHSAKEFVPIETARYVSSSQRAALVALDTTRFDPQQRVHTPDVLSSGRSAAVGVPVSQGFKITDARGASIRYVGP